MPAILLSRRDWHLFYLKRDGTLRTCFPPLRNMHVVNFRLLHLVQAHAYLPALNARACAATNVTGLHVWC